MLHANKPFKTSKKAFDYLPQPCLYAGPRREYQGISSCFRVPPASVQYRSKVLVHFPRYCRGGIAVSISGLTSGKPRLTSLKTPVLPRFLRSKIPR